MFGRTLTRRQSIGLVVVILFLFFVGGSLLVRHQTAQQSIPVVSVATPIPLLTPITQTSGFVLNEFYRSQTKDGRTVWEVHGRQGQYFPAESKAVVIDAELTLSRTPDEEVQLTAGQATLYLSGVELLKAEVSGNVLLNYKDNVHVATELAVYAKDSNTVTAPGDVAITNDVIDVRGTELVADLNTQEFLLKRNVETTVKPRSKEQ